MPPINLQQLSRDYPAIGLLPRSFLLGSDFQTFAAELKGFLEIIRWTWYSFKAYPVGGNTQILYFDQNIGQATNRLADTNMQVGGQLSGGEAMLVRNIRVVPIPAGADAFVLSGEAVALRQWYNVLTLNCWLAASVGDKVYVQGAPLTLFPAGQGLGSAYTANVQTGTGAGPTNAALVQNGHPSNLALWETDPPMYVPSTRTITVSLNWITAQAVTTAGRLGVMLDGWRIRLVQ